MQKKHKLAWLISLLALLLVMISVGGVTRLTRSGLSITEWKPVTGILPPMSDQAWQQEFDLYKNSPEFKQANSHFQLNDYKNIYWWEYLHRLLGRVIFFVAVALSYVFWKKKEFTVGYALSLPLLIVVQGVMGWLMVKTGLNHRPAVSHYMLSIHYFLALATMVMIYFPIAKMKSPLRVSISPTARKLLIGLGILLLVQIAYGCFTSGLKAGLYHGTFPLMGGQFFPSRAFGLVPMISNFFENPILVQWVHRWLGISTGVYLLGTSYYLIKFESPAFVRPLLHLVSIIVVQIILGILILINQVPTSLAVTHQLMAALIVLGYFNIVFRIEAVPARVSSPSPSLHNSGVQFAGK